MNADYSVVTSYEAIDKQTPTINKIAAASDKAAKGHKASFDWLGGIGRLADTAGGYFDQMASKAASVAKVIGAAGIAGAVLGVKTGIVDVNAKLEDSKIGLATSLNMLGGSSSFHEGLGLAQTLMDGIRKDAAMLPGEFGDFVGMAQSLTAPLTNAGKGIGEIRSLTRDTVVAAAALGIGFDQAGREMAMLLEGRAGAHNVLGMRMGIDTHTMVGTKAFNKASESERYDFLSKALEKAKDSLPAFQQSWSGLTSTMADGVKRLLGVATLPLFERLKTSFGSVNDFLGSQRSEEFAQNVGDKLGRGYDYLVDKTSWLEEHWEGIRESGLKFGRELRAGFERAWPIIEKIGGFLGRQLEDPGKFLAHLAEARGGLALAGNLPMLGKLGGMGEAVAATGPVGLIAATAALAAFVAVIDNVGGSANLVKEDVAALGASLAEAFKEATKEGSVFRQLLGHMGASVIKTADSYATPATMGINYVTGYWKTLNGTLDVVESKLGVTNTGFETTASHLDLASEGMDALRTAATGAINPLGAVAGILKQFGFLKGDQFMGSPDEAIDKTTEAKFPSTIIPEDMPPDYKRMLEAAKKDKTGKGATSVTNNIQMTVMSESDPERFTRSVATLLDARLRQLRRPVGVSTAGQY